MDELLNNKNFTLALVALVLYLAFLYCNEMNKPSMVKQGFGNVPLNLLDQSQLNTAWGDNCGGYRRYNNPMYAASDEANEKLQKARGLQSRSHLDRGDIQFRNYMEMDKMKITQPYSDEYNMSPSYYPKPITEPTYDDCPCAKRK
jgi:hypothetical protein